MTKNLLFYFLLSFMLAVGANAQNCTVNAGVGSTICMGQPFNVSGGIGGLVQASSIQWSIVAQPAGANISFANNKSMLPGASTATIAGTYTFRLSATCQDNITTTNDVTYTVAAFPATPTITGSFSFNCYVTGTPINISATPPGIGQSAQWRIHYGYDGGSFGNASAASTTFTPYFLSNNCSSPVQFVLEYSITNIATGCRSSAYATYTFERTFPFSATAIPLNVCGTSTNLIGSCIGNSTSVTWSQISSGPNTATITSPTSNRTTATGLVPGTYVFRYTVLSGCSPGTADVTVTVAGARAVSNANAGKDLFLCNLPATASLQGNTPAVGETVSWTKLSGGTTITFSNPNAPGTIVSGLTDAGAPYTFLYTISNGICFSQDTITIRKIPTLTLTAYDDGYCGPTSGNYNSPFNFTIGDYKYPELDTVLFTFTYVSGPPAATSVLFGTNKHFIIGSGISSSPANFGTSPNTVNMGQSATHKISGNSLYASFPETVNWGYRLGAGINLVVPGTYKFNINFTTQCSSYTKTITVYRGLSGSLVNAGTDILLGCNATNTTLVGNLADNLGQWETIQKPVSAIDPIVPANKFLHSPQLSGLIPGTYLFRHSNNTGPTCTSASDDVKVVVANNPPATPNAGADRTTCGGSIRLSGSAIPNNALGVWAVVSPIGNTVSLSDPSSATPTAVGLMPNKDYIFRYTVSNGCDSAFDEVVITTTNNVSPSKPTLDVFGDCALTYYPSSFPSAARLYDFTNSDRGNADTTWQIISEPAGAVSSFTWSLVTPTTRRLIPTVNQACAISVIYRLSNNACPGETVADTVTLFVGSSPINNPFSAGIPQQFCAVSSYPIMATLQARGPLLSSLLWNQTNASGGQNSSITSPTAPITTVSIPSDGIYNYRFQIVPPGPVSSRCSGALGLQSNTQIIASSRSAIALAGPDISFCNNTGITSLGATAIAAPGSGRWEIADIRFGTAPVIANSASPTSNITFSGSGSVILKWNSYGAIAECGPSSTDLVTVTYHAPANAGNDQTLCTASFANLNALSPAPAVGSWTQVSGPSTASFVSAASPQTIVTGLTNGTYIFRWGVTAPGGCVTADSVSITISAGAAIANAGFDTISCSGGTNKTPLAAVAAPPGYTGTWSVALKPAGAPTGSFDNINSPNAVYNGVTLPGSYVFAWTISNGICTSTDFITLNAIISITCTTPVSLVSFTANINKAHCKVILNWETSKEINSLKYTVEKSADAITYLPIQDIAAAGNSNQKTRYRYTDADVVGGNYFYRLKMTDIDGTVKYSDVIHAKLNCTKDNFIEVIPNPVGKGQDWRLRVNVASDIASGILEIRDTKGRLLQQQQVMLKKGVNMVKFSGKWLAGGIYTVTLHAPGLPITAPVLLLVQ